jgi:hypothetical protein
LRRLLALTAGLVLAVAGLAVPAQAAVEPLPAPKVVPIQVTGPTTRTLSGKQNTVLASSGVTCLTNAQVSGTVTVRSGASLVVKDSTINGALVSAGAQAVQMFGTTVTGAAQITGTTRDITIAGSTFKGAVVLANNTQVTANDRFSRLAGAYGPLLVGSKVTGALACSGNSAPISDFGAKNTVTGARTGDCAKL